MCGVKLNERKKSEELRGLEPVSLKIKNSRWFGHVEQKKMTMTGSHVV